MLFYQYVEPPWSAKEHKKALKKVLALGNEHGVCGRGRCAAEGLNCTLTGSAAGVRAFCNGLRAWKPELFESTDFKLTDGLAPSHAFKALTIRSVDELVGYGLPVQVAPALKTSNARHVEADEYHQLMSEPNTVIVDVRNAYESAIGHFEPPEGGAKLIDPKLRNSHEFPKWLQAPATQEQLQGKKVLMYCTGGIRCERASALLDAMTECSDGRFQTDEVVMVRGGIERYMKTFPEGGHWRGKNYLFDRRLEQVPEKKSASELAAEVDSVCCVCHAPWATYRGQFKCAGSVYADGRYIDCGVPVIVCHQCAIHLEKSAKSSAKPLADLRCPLCEEGYQPPQQRPDLGNLREEIKKRRLDPESDRAECAAPSGSASAPTGAARSADSGGGAAPSERRDGKRARRDGKAAAPPSSRLFVGSLPFLTSAAAVRAALAPQAPSGGGSDQSGVVRVHWLHDRKTKLFYGSAFVQMASVDAAAEIVRRAGEGVRIADGSKKGRRLVVNFAPPKEGEEWPPAGEERERPAMA